MVAPDHQSAGGLADLYRASGVGRDWAAYVQRRHGVSLACRRCLVPLDGLIATQPEIELIKYRLVKDEGFRAEEPIVVYKGRGGPHYVVDGHTRARVKWDAGEKAVAAFLMSSPEVAVELDLANAASLSGAGKPRHIGDVPITDRLGDGTEAWARRRREVLGKQA